MKLRVSLKLFVILSLVSLLAVLVVGYSLLSVHFYHKGMQSITAGNMEKIARKYVDSVLPEKRKQLNSFSGYLIAPSWEQLPLEIQQVFGQPPAKRGFVLKGKNSNLLMHPKVLYFLFHYEDSNGTLFVCRRRHKGTPSPLMGENAAESRRTLFTISIVIVVFCLVIFLLLLRRVAKPVTALGQWARLLNTDNLSKPPPDFFYPELNNLAELIRTSLSSVQESLNREHSFLHHASHELRTPITIIRNNIELLYKLKQSQAPARTVHQEKAIDRIDRASLNMQYLTETLLWLSRKEVAALPGKQFELDRFLAELVEEMRYLLDRKEVELKLETSPFMVFLPEIPARIVLGNLVRNAFQHSWKGCITIQQKGNRVDISNPLSPADTDQHNQGSGLGLQLTIQLANKLNWIYKDESAAPVHQVSIIFGNRP